MVKLGGPCEAPVDDKQPPTLCGITEITDKSDWRKGKEEHAGKWCCTKADCRRALKVIPSKVVPAAAPAAAEQAAEQAAARAAADQAAQAAATQQPAATTEAAAAAGTAAAAVATPPRPAYARYWKELSSAERQAAEVLGHSHTSWDPQVDREFIAALAAQTAANGGNQCFTQPQSAAAREQQRSSEQRMHFEHWKEMIASERGERIMGAMRAGLDSLQQPYFANASTDDWYEHFGIAYEYGSGVESVSPA